ncbi:MAG: helix-turn-helix domain-containing protein [Bacteroides cellulosilyticus]|nr:helix-turn-helix domain-containing protein [Bacteroides cellulosilyticus]
MGALNEKRLGKVVRDVSDWIEKEQETPERIEALQIGARIVLKIKRHMRMNDLSQKQLADKLSVSPQFINKLLHGEAADMKISTAVRYGKILGIKLIEIPEEQPQTPVQIVLNPITVIRSKPVIPNPKTYTYSKTISLLNRKSQNKDQYGKRPS